MNKLNKHFHFMGISGIGMSGIAKILKQQGYTVSGCDNGIDLKHVQELTDLGCNIASYHQHSICYDHTIDTIVYTSAIPTNHPEILRAIQNGIQVVLRADMLAKIMASKQSIAVTGSHGKTSTSSLLSHLLIYTNQDPTIVVGGHIHSIKSNALYGNGRYLVAEADESDRSFLKLPKQYAIITNINVEHLETYKDFDDIKKTFLTFINNTPQKGLSILCLDSLGIQEIVSSITTPYKTYGLSKNADIQPVNITLNPDNSTFDIYLKHSQQSLGTITISQPGIHYVMNATAVITLALHLDIRFKDIQNALKQFTGVDRRFSFKGISKKHEAHIFDDYGHHPLEIQHALTVARNKTSNNLIVVFQPHRFSRTKHLWNDFVNTFAQSDIDTLIITDIFPASEKPIDAITSLKLVEAIKAKNPRKQIFYCPFDQDLSKIEQLIDQTTTKDDLLLLLGAGKVNKLASKLL